MNTFNPGEFGKNLDNIANASSKRTAEDVAKLTGTEVPVAPIIPSQPLTEAQKDAKLKAAVNNLVDHLETIATKNAQATEPEKPAAATPDIAKPETLLQKISRYIGTGKKY